MITTSDNFGQKSPCKVCHLEDDTISHVLNCIIMKLNVPEILNYSDISVSDAFKNNMTRLNTLSSVFEKDWRKRNIFRIKTS